jgi:phosphatidylglycerophosphate synthase
MLAVVLAVPLQRPDDSVSPSRKVAGISLALRGVLTMQQRGAQPIVLVVRSGATDLVEAVQGDPRVTAELTCVEVPAGRAVLAELAGAVSEPFLLARYDRVVDPGIYGALVEQPLEEAIGRLASRDGRPLGPLWATPALLEAAVDDDLSRLMERPDVVLCDVGPRWAVDATSPRGRGQITRSLLEDCRKPVDGIVSRHLNRHISLFISRLVVNTPITPNMMTLLTFGVALVAAWFAFDGSYTTTLVAALLMQANSILDGCDGELARVRFQGSKLGQWLDTIGDDTSNVLFWTALGFGARGAGDWGYWLAICGWVAAVANLLAAVQWYALLRTMGSGDLNALQDDDGPPAPGFIGGVVAFASLVLKQDFFIFFLACLALAGVIHQSLPLFALGGLVTLGAATVRTVQAWRLRHAAAQPNSK